MYRYMMVPLDDSPRAVETVHQAVKRASAVVSAVEATCRPRRSRHHARLCATSTDLTLAAESARIVDAFLSAPDARSRATNTNDSPFRSFQ